MGNEPPKPGTDDANETEAGQPTEYCGLSTTVALQRLHDDIETLLSGYEERFGRLSWLAKVRSTFADDSATSPLGWFPTLATVACGLSLASTGYHCSAGLLIALLLLTVAVVVRENNLRKTEIYRKVRTVLHEIRLGAELCAEWTIENYPHLCSPLSPCVTLQWTYRDGRVVNLPWALLVRGDHIVMRPGQVSPGTCTEVRGRRRFKCGETYGLQQPTEQPVRPIARSPLPDLVCVVEATPYLDILRKSLDCFLDRPRTIINQQRELLVSHCLQRWGFGIVLLLTGSVGLLRNVGLYFAGKLPTDWMNVCLLNPTAAVLPLLPLIFPLLWVAINLWGVARLETLLSIPQAVICAQAQKSFQEDLDTPTCDLDHVKLPRRTVFFYWWQLIKGRSELLGRSASVVQVLGTITALCCVDKKGILSWPNPTAEKVFFLRNAREGENTAGDQSDQSSLNSQSSQKEPMGAIAEVLDLTHDQHSPFKLEFDDHDFKNHLTSLKPLGLAILVNTCCPLTQAHYAKFCGHVTAAAMLDKDLVPVTNRYAIVESSLNCFMHGRCLCELAKQIGFLPQARDIFQLEGQISSYRHLQPDVVRRDIRFARSLQLATKVKVPFPHSLSVVMREINNGSLQLLTQGTADIVLDCCDDYWDGHDLQPLTEKERKRAQDFYQRSALTAYCTAFAYRPLRHGIRGALSGGQRDGNIAYLELPPESKHRRDAALYQLPHRPHQQPQRENYSDLLVDALGGAPLAHHSISTDSLLFTDNRDDDISDVDGCYRMQCHQVFIGMVTMQYQAQTDIVQLIERLERACIRFVHFSKENELRSRVFSEKMGLESGWNCHISLLSEASDSRASSPSPSPSPTPTPTPTPTPGERNHLLHPTTTTTTTTTTLTPGTGTSLEATRALSSSAPCAISQPAPAVSPSAGVDPVPADGTPAPAVSWQEAGQQQGGQQGHCRSLSCLTDSTEQSAPINFDMSNRAKLPRGIENIRPHLENVDNVPLLVSLFTDCSAEATREMLRIMQQYGEIRRLPWLIFLQGDCSIAIEPLYPQVCQEYPAYSESNIYNNRAGARSAGARTALAAGRLPDRCATISPVYLSRILNSIACSIATCRDDPISIVAVIELSRRFMAGLWSCVQFWACCGASLAIMNTVTACLSLPPMIVPLHALYLMCVVVPLVALTLLRVEPDPALMKRATGKKQKTLSSRLVLFVLWCYGFKFALAIAVLVLAYCTFLSHPIELFAGGGGGGGIGGVDGGDLLRAGADVTDAARVAVQQLQHRAGHPQTVGLVRGEQALAGDLHVARSFILLGTVLHFVTISASFVHRDHICIRRSPLSNLCWVSVVALTLLVHLALAVVQLLTDDYLWQEMDRVWPIVLCIVLMAIATFFASEIFKWEEIKVNSRYIRRARLDFGTKLGMNSPF
ncbi:AGAP000576-PA-like protein [Anopheles sinensis]|uniref:AGAP000576-PA-like protein n=1 Tax=Anopheles sinensis TaxID=74873 RepID=A0A084VAA9_ANOSI|nr:AGAP000576-PA-like protein [Anopheles sinensis]